MNGFIAISPEVLGQRNNVWLFFPEVSIVFYHANSVRTRAGHQTRTRRAAYRLLAIRSIKKQSFRRQGI
jgi:hypothetical protein